jgi:alpha-L-fucosidase
MKLADALVKTVELYVSAPPDTFVDMDEFVHQNEKVRDHLHRAMQVAMLRNIHPEMVYLAMMGWVVDAICYFGYPDDVDDLPAINTAKFGSEVDRDIN